MSDISSDSNSSDNESKGGEKKRFHGRAEGSYDKEQGGQYEARDNQDRVQNAAMEVVVENNIEKAMKVLKRKLIKEGLFKELKSRKYFEKPSERKKRKKKESVKKVRKDVLRSRKNAMLLS